MDLDTESQAGWKRDVNIVVYNRRLLEELDLFDDRLKPEKTSEVFRIFSKTSEVLISPVMLF